MTNRNSRLACIAAAFIATLSLAACQSTPPGKPTPITYNDTQTLPASALKTRALAQLDSLLTPAPPPPRSVRFNTPDRFDSVWLATTPRFDPGIGMCTYDLLQMNMRPDDPLAYPDGDTPTNAVGLGATTWFAPVPKGVNDCNGHTPATHHYFKTDQPLRAAMDLEMLKDVIVRFNTPDPGFELVCGWPAGCAKLRAEANADTLWDMDACTPTAPNSECRHFSWRDPEYIEIYITFDTPGLNRRIRNVRLEAGVIL